MPRKPPQDVASRRIKLIELIAAEPLSAEEILDRLRPRAAKRTVHEDIAWLLETFPEHFRRERAAGQHGPSRVAFRWVGNIPYLLQKPVTWLTEDELIALVAARGFLRDADPTLPATASQLSDHDLLATAVSRLLVRAGVQDAADILSRSSVTVSRFGAAPTDPACLAACLAATATAEGLEFDYINLKGGQSHRHVAPQRMVLIKGEWYVVAWAESLRTFRLERMANAKRRSDLPSGKPVSIPSHEVDALLQNAFFATSSNAPKDRKKVIMAISPDAWPFIKDRRWGDKLDIDHRPKDLPEAWRRLTFVTTGIHECQHWILGMGANVQAEHPKDLVEWIAKQSSLVAKAAQANLKKNAAESAVSGATMR
jgi:predicted DNA-binding transcriptional regulator YafY